MTAEHRVEELSIPETLDSAGGADFAVTIEVRNAAETHSYGSPELEIPADEILAHWNDPHQPQRLWAVRLDGRIVARMILGWQLSSSEVAWVTIQVHPEFE